LLTAKFSKRPEEIFEAGRSLLLDQYKEWERQRAEPDPHKAKYERQVIDEFETYLEPAPKQYANGVFAFYLEHTKELDPVISSKHKDRLILLIAGSVFKNIDPANYDLTASSQQPGPVMAYSVGTNISLFGDALRLSHHLSVDVSEFRQRVINYIPFAYGDHLRAIFNLIPNHSYHRSFLGILSSSFR
jgi:hypothetical protein